MTILSSVFVRAHRAIFTAATATLGVAASLIASDASQVANWLLLVGAGVVMAAEDVCREVEGDARKLSKDTETDVRKTRVDVLGTHHPTLLAISIILGLVALGAGVSLRSAHGSGNTTPPEARTYKCTVLAGDRAVHRPFDAQCSNP